MKKTIRSNSKPKPKIKATGKMSNGFKKGHQYKSPIGASEHRVFSKLK